MIPYDLESYQLHLKTTSKLGSKDVIALQLMLYAPSESEDYSDTTIDLQLHLTKPPKLTIGQCIKKEAIKAIDTKRM